MTLTPILRQLPKLALAALFATGTASAVIGTEAANPATTATTAGLLGATSAPAAAQGYRGYRRGWYPYRGQYWEHRRWRAPYWDRYHRRQPGVYIYF